MEFILVTKHPENPEQGIFQSHQHCLQQGLATGARRILIFEDDVVFRDHAFHRRLEEACRALNEEQGWEALFLGCISQGSHKTRTKSLRKIRYRCLAHAYALNRPLAGRLAREPWSGIPFDELLRRYRPQGYALFPMCAFQGEASSDNHTVSVDRLRRLLGGLAFIQRANELYQNHRLLLLLVPAALLLAILLGLGR
ncbi:glycosyltransferase family 25 protein [Desulfogranum mediterraneum]|uniref:glycosyltransferase n=1 Tax=Desulfogranum mediterraneum TaxID=160661 RepID=UPI0012947105|nr:glycosyltransferase [Desulfogranum mediterraneum]